MSAANAADVLNLVGFATGTALYALLLALVLRGARAGADAGRRDVLPLTTALLGLAWNLAELAVFALPRLGLTANTVGLSAVSFPALGLLAAVVVHSVARGLRWGRPITALAYVLALVAAALHLRTIVSSDPAASTLAFQLLTVSFSLLIVPLALVTGSQPNGRRAFWMLALVLVAVSATHLGSFHTGDDTWWMQIVGHHAAIPLAFAILYQNYRFALGDLFLKHALSLLAVVGLALAGYSIASAMPAGPGAVAMLLGLWVATALVSPWLRRVVVHFVDAVLLGRMDYAALRHDFARAAEEASSTSGVLDAFAARLATAFDAHRVWWSEEGADGAGADPGAGASRTVVVPTTDPPRLYIHVGTLAGGRRLLSDDEALLEAVAALAARRIDAIRLTLERYETQLREEEMSKLAAEAELKALRAQINPHFLFNALTTIGYLIEAAPARAVGTLMRLTELMRGALRPEGEFTTLGREIELVAHYLDIERERFEERLRVRLDVPPELGAARIPALVVQPLVENAVKHGIAKDVRGGEVEVAARREATPAGARLRVTVRNTGAPLETSSRDGNHVGLDNVSRRLAGHYGPAASISLRADGAGGTVATLVVPLADAVIPDEEWNAEAVAHRAGR